MVNKDKIMNDNIYISEINETEFEEKVLIESKSLLVIVDFWAPWCGPCKQLTPLLEKITNQAKGKVKLIKINIDENQQIASQLRVQSIPAVFAFKDGKPIDAFQGVIPENKILAFIEKSLGQKLEEDHTEYYKSVKELISNKKFVEAKNSLEIFLTKNPNEFRSLGMLIDCLTSLEQYEDAKKFTESLNDDALSNRYVNSSIQKLLIKIKNNKGPALSDLIDSLKKKPNDINIITSLADKFFAEDMIDETFELLLLNYKKNKEKIKKKFLEFFEALGNDNAKTVEYRKKFSSIMFS
jgi:putative thioredoxin